MSIEISYKGNVIASVADGKKAIVRCNDDKMKGDLEIISKGGDSPLPIEIATADEMTALLETAEVGAIYKYTGATTDTYENGALYIVEESE